MPRIRSIHHDALKSEKLAASSAEGERLYWRLSTHCDDEGRAEDDPRIFAAYLFPLRDDITGPLVDGWLEELANVGLIVRYTVEGRRYLAVTRWADYQRPNKPSRSTLPPLPEDYGNTTGVLPLGEGVGEGEGDTPRKRGTRAPATFEITEDLQAWAVDKRICADLTEETDKFLDYHRAKGSVFKDWTAAWYNWMRRSKSFSTNGSTSHDDDTSWMKESL